ncbi:hypothetical protein [Butyrivibrio proteoclasticus]|uniref:hypothetical protein n=1 Tax=Butyrivibrio proteoclasticus TaxID=43305 RepID=UPI00047A1F0C|nr:hypothetical protein [Butyrivibrio proteoclasticus]
MKSTKIVPGQTSFFDFIMVTPVGMKAKCTTLAEFYERFSGYEPASDEERRSIISELMELIGKDAESHGLVHSINPSCNGGELRLSWDDDKVIYWNINIPATGALKFGGMVEGGLVKLHSQTSLLVNIFDTPENIVPLALKHFATLEKPKKTKPKKKEQLSPVQKFIKEYDGYRIEDACSVASDDFKSYCRKLKSALAKEAKLVGFDSVTLKPNHYDMSGFFNKGDKYVYWSFNVERGDMPTYLTKTDAMHGFLYRTAASNKDFKGGNNHFTDLKHLCVRAYELI